MTNQLKHSYKPGQPYKMRNGEKAVFVGENPFNKDKPLVFVDELNSEPDEYTLDGKCCFEYDIIGEWQEPKKVKGWVNIVSEYIGDTHPERIFVPLPELHDSREKALEHAGPNRIACIPIEFTEGEGL